MKTLSQTLKTRWRPYKCSMQPVQAQKGVSTKSHLFDSLKVYLNNKNRLQPIIGLGSIIECVKAGTHNREALYLCEVCLCRLSQADIRNHIMGSLHRYNYIKAGHPNLVSEGKENSDLSKMAWSLMEVAKTLEGEEGHGDVQLLEVEEAVYQKMATHSENDAVTLINILRDGQGESESHSDTATALHYPIQSLRIVLLAPNQRRQSEKSIKTSAETHKPPSLVQSTVAPFIQSERWLNNTSTSPEPSVLPENSNSFLHDHTGAEPLIGLFRMVECRGEDGHTYCFLCHCCRIRSNQKDIIDHLTSSSHLVNYLMESHPEQVEIMMADINDDHQLLQSLAKKVEQEEGRGELKVVIAPESLCILLTIKSYHWCIKMLCNEGTDIQKRSTATKGPSVSKTSNQVIPENCAVVLSKVAKKTTTKRKMRKVSNPVFKVSLPLTKASVLLERTSFSVASASSSSSNSDLVPLPESPSEDFPLDCDTGSCAVDHAEHTSVCTTSQLQQDHYSGVADAGQYMGPERNFSQHQEVDGYFRENEYFNQSEDTTGTQDQMFHGEQNFNRPHGAHERSNKRFYKEWQNEGLLPAVCHAQDWSSCNSFYGPEEGYTVQWYNSASQRDVGTRVELSRGESLRGMTSDATQHYYQQQQPQNQYMAGGHTSLLTGSVGQHGLSGELADLDAARINTHPHLGYSLAHSGIIAAEPRLQFLEIEQKQLQTNMEFNVGHVQTAPQSYMTQPAAYQAVQVGHGVMSNPSYNTRTNPDQHLPHHSVLWSSL